MRSLRVAVILAAGMVPCVAQRDYCGLLQQSGAIGLRPPSSTAEDIVKDLGKKAPFTNANFMLHNARDPDLKLQGAAAQICNGNQRYIFYDPDFVDNIRRQGGSDWPKYFTFAHEVAHHVNGDTLLHHEDASVELGADRSAAIWLARLGASLDEIVGAINALGFSDQPRQGYPGRCQRVEVAIRGYNDVAAEYNEHGGKMPVYDVCGCMPVAPGGGLYANRDIAAGARLQPLSVMSCRSRFSLEDVPKAFSHDVDGMCAVSALPKGARLTWNNIGVCSLMH